MEITNFLSGKYLQHYFNKDYAYKSFSPSFINKQFDFKDNKITVLLEEAVKLLSELNGYSFFIPDVNFFIRMHVVKEATTSSRIEGIKTVIDDAILAENEISLEKRNDWEEVQNYIKAINYAVEQLEKLPLCLRLIKDTHRILLSGVRGKEKQPGEIRISQNWIGGSNINDAFFLPPHYEELPGLLDDLEKFWHNKALNIPNFIKIAITHYQFETIHPFLDGNGRIGRLLIILQLIESNILDKPTLYLSDFFEKHRTAYYDSLNMVRQSNDIEQWIKFFLSGIIDTAKDGKNTFKNIIRLKEIYEQNIKKFGRPAEQAKELLLYMFSNPIIKIGEISQQLKISYNTANGLIRRFLETNMVKEITGSSRNRLFVLWEYFDLFKK